LSWRVSPDWLKFADHISRLILSRLAAGAGACAAALRSLQALIERRVLAAARLHGDDTTVPILAKGRPVGLFYPSRDRTREHPNRHLSLRRRERDEDGIGAVAAWIQAPPRQSNISPGAWPSPLPAPVRAAVG
jgi:hypothetical protein